MCSAVKYRTVGQVASQVEPLWVRSSGSDPPRNFSGPRERAAFGREREVLRASGAGGPTDGEANGRPRTPGGVVPQDEVVVDDVRSSDEILGY